MRYFDEITEEEIFDPDLEKGKVAQQDNPIVHTYVVSTQEQGHYETVAEYPNGGKDVEWVVDVEEQGYWKTEDERGEFDWQGEIPEDAPHEIVINDIEVIGIYHTYTPEEIEEMERKKREAEEAAERERKLKELLDGLEEYQIQTDAAICELYESGIEVQ